MTRDHVCLSSIDWDFLWQGPQEVMSRAAARGSRVVFVENTGIRGPRRADAARIVRRLRAFIASPSGHPVHGAEGIHVLSPVIVPFPWSNVGRILNRLVFAARLPQRVAKLGLRRPVVWTFLPNQVALDVMRAFRPTRSLAVYYCVAEFEHLADDRGALRSCEDRLVREVDIVLAGSRALLQRFAATHPRVLLAPYAVSDAFFSPAGPPPDDIARIPQPRIGYVGGLHRHVDDELLSTVASRMTDVHFVLVGPRVSGPWPVERLPNVHVLGARDHDRLPAYIDAFDAGLVPYRLSPFAQSAWPTKLHEYLARGKPVVTTPLTEVLELGYDKEIVRVAATAADTVAAIRRALGDADERAAAVRRELAREHSWGRLYARIEVEIDAAVADRERAPSP